jgi:hypothetical protein
MAETDRQAERCRGLIQLADEVLATYQVPLSGGGVAYIGPGYVDAEKFRRWRSSSLAFLEDLVGPDHVYAAEFRTSTEHSPTVGRGSTEQGKGVLLAVLDDLEAGYLTSIRRLIRAEVFTDLLDMAEHLHDAGYHHAAVSIAGAVLEDGLRQIAESAGVKANRRDDLAALNSKLHQAKAYDNLVRKEVGVWTDLRNAADHGEWDKVDDARTGEMIRGVTRFLAAELPKP